MQTASSLGAQLKQWRGIRGVSQLQLANEIGVSARHLCFVETGRAMPSQEMLHRLSDGLEVPLRERNSLFHSAGFAPAYANSSLDAPELSAVVGIVQQLLKQQEPYPAMAMDRYWDLRFMNEAATRILAPFTVGGRINAIELFLGNSDIRKLIDNWREVALHTRERLRAQLRRVGDSDERLSALGRRAEELLAGIELSSLPATGPVLTTRLKVGEQIIETVGTIASFSGASDASVEELRVELTFPANDHAAACFHAVAAQAEENLKKAAPFP